MAISNTTIASSNTVVYTSTGNNGNAITTIMVCNTATYDPLNPTAGQTNLFLYIVPAAEVSGNNTLLKHTVINGLPIPAGETVSLDQEKIVLEHNAKIIAKSSSPANLAITISSLEV